MTGRDREEEEVAVNRQADKARRHADSDAERGKPSLPDEPELAPSALRHQGGAVGQDHASDGHIQTKADGDRGKKDGLPAERTDFETGRADEREDREAQSSEKEHHSWPE